LFSGNACPVRAYTKKTLSKIAVDAEKLILVSWAIVFKNLTPNLVTSFEGHAGSSRPRIVFVVACATLNVVECQKSRMIFRAAITFTTKSFDNAKL
jgi:hypothetical protein